jgi:MFS family permease
MMATVTFLKVAATSGLGFSLVPHLREAAGLTTPQAAGVLSISTFLALSSLAWGQLAGRLTARWCIVGALSLSAAAALALLRVDSLLTAYVFGVLWGLFHSGLEVLMYILLADYFGRNSYGAIAGTLRPFEAGGLGVGQLVGPLIYDLTGSYTLLILLSSILLISSAALMLLTRRPVRPVTATGTAAA